VRPTTRALFAESITNPIAQVLDVRAVADIAHGRRRSLVVRQHDRHPPYLQRAKDLGADITVHSATKFLGGHGTSLGGVIVDLGTFDFTAEPQRWPQLTATYPRVPDGSLVERFGAGGSPYIALVKTKYVHDLGPSLSAFNAFQLLQGLETLDLRIDRHSASALRVARFLDESPAVARVHHPGLESSPWHAHAASYLPRGAGSVFAFDLHSAGDPEADFRAVEELIARLQVIKLVANIGDARSPRRPPGLDDAQPPERGAARRGGHRMDDGAPVDRSRGPRRHRRRPRAGSGRRHGPPAPPAQLAATSAR
jgi:O-acetylhomoserine (thiol)-lyase